jgi:hypothetical protein
MNMEILAPKLVTLQMVTKRVVTISFEHGLKYFNF